jgi:poly(3-hydroxybutyrate) depolymerase
MTGFSDPYFNHDAIAVYPEGLDYKTPGHQWLGDPEAPPSSVVDDREFVKDVLDSLMSTFCIDENRIYAAGFSNGGGMVGLLACSPLVNRRIAAFATAAGAFYADASLTEPLFGKGCQPDLATRKRIPIMSFHGSDDKVIAYDGNNSPAPNTIPISEWLRAWAARQNCVIRGPRTVIYDAWIAMFGWSCQGDAETGGGVKDVVMNYKIANFGHGWPRTVSLEGSGTTNLNATRHMMIFFDEWRLDQS